MRVKQDAIPGVVQPMWFTPTMTDAGIACSRLCGLAHYRMKAFYTIHTPEQYEDWLQEEVAALQTQ
jgi:cytochrome c oxidase subunit 2